MLMCYLLGTDRSSSGGHSGRFAAAAVVGVGHAACGLASSLSATTAARRTSYGYVRKERLPRWRRWSNAMKVATWPAAARSEKPRRPTHCRPPLAPSDAFDDRE